jgi:hypothetical protein
VKIFKSKDTFKKITELQQDLKNLRETQEFLRLNYIPYDDAFIEDILDLLEKIIERIEK